jgi:hypothetical protein
VKDGRWENYSSENELENKVYYEKGFTAGSILHYYDASKKKIQEVIPRFYGKIRGTYYAFYPNGSLKEDGRLDDSVKVGRWREYHEVGSGGRLKKEWKYGKDKFDTAEPLLIQERDQQSKIIFQTKEPISQHKPTNLPPMDTEDDEDSEEDDSTKEAHLVLADLASIYQPFLTLRTPADFHPALSTGFINTPQTPPDFVF